MKTILTLLVCFIGSIEVLATTPAQHQQHRHRHQHHSMPPVVVQGNSGGMSQGMGQLAPTPQPPAPNLSDLGAGGMGQGGAMPTPIPAPSYSGGPVKVIYGVHRTIATLIQVFTDNMDPNQIVGMIDGLPLTAEKLVELYEDGLLRTGNTNSYGVPSFGDGQVNKIVATFDIAKYFDPSRDGGLGIVLSSNDSGAPFDDLRTDYGWGVPLPEYLDKMINKTSEE